ncbi:MAG: polysaccharide biosynthesis protein [Pseudomonadales bacterium]
MAADCAVIPLALWSAIALRLGQINPEVVQFWPAFVVAALICVPIFGGLGLYRHVIRHMGNHAIWAIFKGATLIAIAVTAVAYMVPLKGFPRSVPIIFWMLVTLYVTGTRYAMRSYLHWLARRENPRESVVIFGAGSKGVELAKLLKEQGQYETVAFVDDDPRLQKQTISGIYVYAPVMLEQVLKNSDCNQVFVAVNSTSAEERRRIIEYLEPYGVHVRLIPDLVEIVSGRQKLEDLRDVQLDDLLGRDEVEPLPHLLKSSVFGRRVMVTGAGGSIGSELCRQILRQEPVNLVLLDQSEHGLYQIQRELKQLAASEQLDVTVTALLGSVGNQAYMCRMLEQHGIETLYHAAAYKHVGLVERNAIQGLRNNTFGTLHTALAAMDSGVKDFILISTDKAVRTSSVMGASKRLAEMVLQALQEVSSQTRFSMVRFGNVLGSSGSVVPLFLEQIEKGGPVTVTHAEVTRYFMTIPEAAQLVLQAASMASGGDVFLLDMGRPVRILDLAKRIIRLKGYSIRDEANPTGDIEIKITGLQPGEKLYEELLVGDAVSGTDHRKIMRAEEDFLPWSELRGALNTLEQACDAYDYEAVQTFVEGLVEGSDLASQLGDLRAMAEVVDFKPVIPA